MTIRLPLTCRSLLAGLLVLTLVGAPLPPVRAAAPPLGPVGQVGGVTTAVLLNGNHLYFGVGPRVMVMDVSNPASPVMLGQTGVLSDVVRGLALADNRLYVAADRGGLHILDVSSPARPALIGSLNLPENGVAYGVAVSGSYAYVANWNGKSFRIVDVSNPALPAQVGYLSLSPFVVDVVISGQYAYVADESYGLQILNLSNPLSPTIAATYKPAGHVWDVAVSGSYAYVAHGWLGFRGLDIVNIANPANPQLAGSFPGVSGIAWAVAVSGSRAYVVDYEGLKVLDVSNPAAPALLGAVSTPSAPSGCLSTGAGYSNVPCREVAVGGGYAYVADDTGGVRIIDVGAPAQPHEAAAYTSLNRVADVALAGGYLYAVDNNGLHVFGPSAAGLTRVGYLPTTGSVQSLAVAGQYAYLAESGRGSYWSGMEVIHVANPAQLSLARVITTPASYEVAVDGNRAYLAASNAGLQIFSVADPANPTVLGTYLPPESLEVLRVAVDSGRVYAMVGAYLRHIDVSNPAAPFQTNSVLLGTYPAGVAITGDKLYTVYSNYSSSYLDLFSLSNPISPTLLSSLYLSGWPVGLAVQADQVYVANDQYGLAVVDVSQPLTPTLVSEADFPSKVLQTTAGGGLVAAADWDGGLLVFGTSVNASSGAGITPAGGTFTAPDSQATFNFPSGTFTSTVSLSYRKLFAGDVSLPSNLGGVGRYFDVTAIYSGTSQPAQPAPGMTYTLTVPYIQSELGLIRELTLALYYWDGTQWVREPSSQVLPALDSVVATPGHFSLWAVLGSLNRVFLPVLQR